MRCWSGPRVLCRRCGRSRTTSRSPLTRLRQRLELAQRKATTAAELRASVDGAIAEADAILATFGALLRIAQIESGAIQAGFAECDLSDLLQTVVEVYQPMADEKRQYLSAAIALRLEIFGGRELLAQMLAHLLENAIRHSPAGATISLAADRCDAGGMTVALSGTGPGIPPAEYQNVFRRFYRLEASRTTPGNGLGLSLVAAIAGLHGISIEFADNDAAPKAERRQRQHRRANPATLRRLAEDNLQPGEKDCEQRCGGKIRVCEPPPIPTADRNRARDQCGYDDPGWQIYEKKPVPGVVSRNKAAHCRSECRREHRHDAGEHCCPYSRWAILEHLKDRREYQRDEELPHEIKFTVIY
jgi:hypothetical protein